MMTHRSLTGLKTLCVAAVLLAGCRSPRTTFYALNAVATPETLTPAGTPGSIAVGPVTLPEMADRPQLVLRVAANRVELLEMQRWAAPLRSELPRILAEDLAILLKPSRVAAYPQNAGVDADCRVQVDFQRFEAASGEGVTVDALWSIRRTGDRVSQPGHSVIHELAKGDSYDALVAAYARALAAVSRDIARALRDDGAAPH